MEPSKLDGSTPNHGGKKEGLFRSVYPYKPLLPPHVLAEVPEQDFQRKTGLFNMRYKNQAIEEEYWRYCHRSLEGAMVMLVYFVGGGIFFLQSFDIRYAQLATAPSFLIIGFCLLFDLILHFTTRDGASFTYKTALARHLLQVVAALATMHSTSWNSASVNRFCPESDFYPLLHGGERPSLRLLYQYCIRAVYPFPIATVVFCLPTLRLDFIVHIALAALGVALLALGSWIADSDENVLWLIGTSSSSVSLQQVSTPAAVVNVSILLLAAIVSCTFAAVRNRSLQRQFEASLGTFYQTAVAQKKHEVVNSLLSSMVPATALESLMRGEKVLDVAPSASVLFSDMVQFTLWSSERTPAEVVAMLSVLVRQFDVLALDLGVEKIKTIGDAYWAAAGLPDRRNDHAEVLVTFGLAMVRKIQMERKRHKVDWQFPASSSEYQNPLEWRVGIDSGPLIGGVIGSQQLSYEVFGETSTRANWIEQKGAPMAVVVSEATKELAPSFDYVLHLSTVLETQKSVSSSRTRQAEDQLTVVEEIDNSTEFLEFTNQQEVAEYSHGQKIHLFVVVDQEEEVQSQIHILSRRGTDTPRSFDNQSEAEEAAHRAERLHFVQGQMSKRGKLGEGEFFQDSDSHSSSLQEIKLQYTERRYGCGSMVFADHEAEETYERFAIRELEPQRKGGIIMLLCILAAVFILITADMKHTPLPLNLLLWLLCVVIFSGILGLVVEGQGVVVSALMSGVGSLVLITALYSGTDAVAANSISYILPFFLPTIILPNLHFKSVKLIAMVLVCQGLPLLALDVPQHTRVLDIAMFINFSLAWIIVLVNINEKKLRVQVRDLKVAERLVSRQEVTIKAQEAILETMVPDFVTSSLLSWLSSGYEPSKAVAQVYPKTAIAFLRIVQQQQGPSTTQAKDSLQWLFDGHQEIDKILASASTAPNSSTPPPATDVGERHHKQKEISREKILDKVKTVGDVVMLAGSFRGHSSTEAAVTMMKTVLQIHRQFTNTAKSTVSHDNISSPSSISLTCGLHVGPVMGIVLGYSRLTFDIFGDAVNTCSRVMTSPISKGKVCASSDFLELLPAAPFPLALVDGSSTRVVDVDYGPSCDVKTKGKHSMSLRQVVTEFREN